MITLHSLCEIVAVEPGVIERWIGLALVRPEPAPDGLLFREIDVARVRLMIELEQIGVDEATLPVVMSLLDQLYSTRDQLRKVLGALETLPAEYQETVLSRLP